MYESASQLGVFSATGSAAQSQGVRSHSNLEDSYAQLGIKKSQSDSGTTSRYLVKCCLVGSEIAADLC